MTLTAERTLAKRTVMVQSFTDGQLDPAAPMLGPVTDGGTIIASTAPGCWGPMITPELRGGHEVTRPVHVEGAEVGDAVAIRIRDITITSLATASGHDTSPEGHYLGDPYVAARCPVCDVVNPATRVEGIGPNAVVCEKCGNPVTPFQFVHGYTAVFDDQRQLGVTVPEVVKGRALEGPVIFPLVDDLPPAAVPFTVEERAKAQRLADEYGVGALEESAPISVVGSGPNLNIATDNALARAARLLNMSEAEVRNRATVTGAIEIGRNPGVARATFLAPLAKLDEAGLGALAREQYGL